jgi:hypothetical protein
VPSYEVFKSIEVEASVMPKSVPEFLEHVYVSVWEGIDCEFPIVSDYRAWPWVVMADPLTKASRVITPRRPRLQASA